MEQVVDIAGFSVSNDPHDTLVTYSLGSCIALMIWDPAVQIGGMLHFMLPDSTIDPDKAAKNPCMFVDTGVPLLFKAAYKLGAEKRRIIVIAAGAAQLLDAKGLFNIGKRNHLALRKILWRNNVIIDTEDVGGTASRTVRLQIATGKVMVKSNNKQYELTSKRARVSTCSLKVADIGLKEFDYGYTISRYDRRS